MYVLDEKTILFILLYVVRYIAFRFHCGQIVVKVPRAEPPIYLVFYWLHKDGKQRKEQFYGVYYSQRSG